MTFRERERESTISHMSWTEKIQKPNPDWQSKPSPVVKITSYEVEGIPCSERLARVSPVINVEGEEVVTLDHEVAPSGVPSCWMRVAVKVLEQGGWENPNGLKRKVEFVGDTHDERLANKDWSYTFPPLS